jgi:hypothetical protein
MRPAAQLAAFAVPVLAAALFYAAMLAWFPPLAERTTGWSAEGFDVSRRVAVAGCTAALYVALSAVLGGPRAATAGALAAGLVLTVEVCLPGPPLYVLGVGRLPAFVAVLCAACVAGGVAIGSWRASRGGTPGA